MRRPTPPEKAYAWHTKAMAHIEANGRGARKGPAIYENEPQPGWYMRRLIQKGPFVPCRIWLEGPIDEETGELTGPETLLCEVDGRRQDAASQWTWICGHPITEDQYFEMLAGKFADNSGGPPTWSDQPAPAEPAAPAVPDVQPQTEPNPAVLGDTTKTMF